MNLVSHTFSCVKSISRVLKSSSKHLVCCVIHTIVLSFIMVTSIQTRKQTLRHFLVISFLDFTVEVTLWSCMTSYGVDCGHTEVHNRRYNYLLVYLLTVCCRLTEVMRLQFHFRVFLEKRKLTVLITFSQKGSFLSRKVALMHLPLSYVAGC